MKIVLSRKGFDSKYGGYPSIILPNNNMITFPIPNDSDFYEYSDIRSVEGDSLFDIMKCLKDDINVDKKVKLTPDTHCHLDPDLYDEAVDREEGWTGIFGQIGAAEIVLEKNNVKEGDIFIFFGWFKDAIKENGNYKFSKARDKHVMFGYLQIDKILHPKYDKVPKQFKNHPHVKDVYRVEQDSNTIYIAKDVCTFDKNIKGYGLFKYDKELDLTKENMTRTCWNLPAFFKGLRITYHNENSWKDGYFKSACIGQEFVIEENKEVEKWAIDLIKRHSANRVK